MVLSNLEYATSPQGYLARARERLLAGGQADLFYAALELRSCVEARQADYLDALEKYQGKKVKGWKVGEASRKLLHVWPDPKIARLTYSDESRQFPTYFTPVPPRLARAVEKELGGLLHAQPKFRAPDDSWWSDTRRRLVDTYRDAWIACRGEHMAPPLWRQDTRQIHPVRLYVTEETESLIEFIAEISLSKQRISIQVEYLDEPPADWIPDLDA